MWPLRLTSALVLAIACSAAAESDDYPNFTKLYTEGRLAELVDSAEAVLASGVTSDQVAGILGRAYVDLGHPDSALPHLSSVLASKSNPPKWLTAWSTCYLGIANYLLGKRDVAVKYLSEVVENHATANVAKRARDVLLYTGQHGFFADWKQIETANFVFHFATATRIADPPQYARGHQAVFDTINSFFKATLPKKIDYFVWNDTIQFPGGKPLAGGFARPDLVLVHATHFQTRGHEMTHIISHYAVGSRTKTDFINEGTAVCFDMTTRNKVHVASEAWGKDTVALYDMWQSDRVFAQVPDAKRYAISGAFVEYVIARGGREKFIEFLPVQTLEHARHVYGAGIDTLADAFMSELRRKEP